MESDFTLVYTAADSFKAELAKELLSEKQITFVELNQHDSVIPSIGEIEIYVHESDRDEAAEILKNLIL